MKRFLLRAPAALAVTFALSQVIACRAEEQPAAAASFLQVPEGAPASAVRRAAEAADAYRTGQPVWVVVDPTFPHVRAEVFTDSAAAAKFAMETGGLTIGPVVPPLDFGLRELFIIIHCHDWTTEWVCPEGPYIPMSEVREISVTITPKMGDPIVRTFKPDSIDAVFFTVSAVERFALPYYLRVHGPDHVKQMRDSLEARVRRAAAR